MFRALTFLGTSSGVPTQYRNVSATCLAFADGGVWLFDCGEGTQHQLQRADGLSSGRIERIFITHLHGDHCYGLPGLMCSMSMMWQPPQHASADPDGLFPFSATSPFLEIVGPERTAEFLRSALSCSDAHFPFRYRVTELRENALDGFALHANEAPPAAALPDENGVHAIVAGGLEVRAACLTHRVTSFGYAVRECSRPGTLDRTKAASLGVPAGPLFGDLKAGKSVTVVASDGTQRTIAPHQVVGATIPGRLYVHLGDTCDSAKMRDIARGCDWLVHECTFDDSTAHLAVERGHSTARMAGAFASSVEARELLLTHFSARMPPKSKDAAAAAALIDQASEGAGGAVRSIVTAEDFMTVDMTPPKRA